MKTRDILTTSLALAMLASPGLRAEEPSPEIAGLQQAASDFVAAYNNKDAAAIAALFLENGEITNLTGDDTTTGRADIKAHFEEVFAGKDVPEAAVEVSSVRLVAPNLAIEDGTFHLDPPGDDTPVRSTTYTAVLMKNDAGAWKIASSRDLKDVTDASGQLSDLAANLKGDWTCQKDGLRMDFAFGWDDTGKFLIGEMLTTTDDAEPQTTTIRIGWDGARKTITWWTFDSAGGFAKGDWTPDDEGWIIRTEGSSSSGEATSANQHLTFEGKDTLLWNAKERLIDGEKQPDVEMRIVRQAPEPESDPAAAAGTDTEDTSEPAAQ
jgi:uncharacterized protein (TIGR02246 family)